MKISLKPLQNQVVVITGASSGIGLVTVRMAAQQGEKLVLAARNEEALHQLTDEICSKGGQAIYVIANVGKEEDVNRIAERAIAQFGSKEPKLEDQPDNLFEPIADNRIQGDFSKQARPSISAWFNIYPVAKWSAIAAISVAVLVMLVNPLLQSSS